VRGHYAAGGNGKGEQGLVQAEWFFKICGGEAVSESFGKIREALSTQGAAGVLAEIGVENLATLLRKNADYGSSGLGEPILVPGMDARRALLVRMSDKVARILSLQHKAPEVAEALEDTMLDLANYCLLWVAVPRLTGIPVDKPQTEGQAES